MNTVKEFISRNQNKVTREITYLINYNWFIILTLDIKTLMKSVYYNKKRTQRKRYRRIRKEISIFLIRINLMLKTNYLSGELPFMNLKSQSRSHAILDLP